MARQQPEARIVSAIIARLKSQFPSSSWTKIHGGPYQRAGISDIIGCVDGLFVALEVKVPGKENTLTRLQQSFLDDVKEAGGLAAMVTSAEQAEAIVSDWKNGRIVGLR